jgi:hypothetical protein
VVPVPVQSTFRTLILKGAFSSKKIVEIISVDHRFGPNRFQTLAQ